MRCSILFDLFAFNLISLTLGKAAGKSTHEAEYIKDRTHGYSRKEYDIMPKFKVKSTITLKFKDTVTAKDKAEAETKLRRLIVEKFDLPKVSKLDVKKRKVKEIESGTET